MPDNPHYNDIVSHNDGGDPELYEMPAKKCPFCNKIIDKGGRIWETNNPSDSIGYCNRYGGKNIGC